MVVNTNAPPPPYPGPPESSRDGADYANASSTGGYYTNPDGGYTNSAGQFLAHRGNGGQNARNDTSAGTQTEYSMLEAPPPYHPDMPGSPYTSQEHFYHPLANPRDSGVGMSSSTLCSMTRSTSSINRNSNEEENTATESPPAYSLATTSEEDERDGQEANGRPRGRLDTTGTETEADGNEGHYATLSDRLEEREAPPSYEASNPPEPPPAYELATFNPSNRESSAARAQSRGQQARNGRLGPL
ncbi:hypothetical protein ElyMa_000235300 [Elysia marginata]|uniref:Down syndrome cell adhesion molecule C-terminal domain-containing protein n=1 Tax=Elysia marginata TaxID=1093978 RepID=A0AAV4F215_9GAST|nr:hypothetical protein ElyMa_000235300 [Elysia marginata]